MAAKVINLKRARKQRNRANARAAADAQALARTPAAARARAETDKSVARIDAHRLDPPKDDTTDG